jgi:uncharacterized protein
MPNIVLQLRDLGEEPTEHHWELGNGWLGAQLADAQLRVPSDATPGRVNLTAQRNGREVLVYGKVKATVVTECVRCLEDAQVAVDTELTVLFVPEGSSKVSDDDDELSADELDVTPYRGPQLVLDELVREHVVLGLPMQPLCSPDCGGIEVPPGIRPKPEDFPPADGVGALGPALAAARAKPAGDEEH